MVVRNEYLPCFRQITSKFMPVTEKDLLDLISIDPNDPFIAYLGKYAHDLLD